MFGRGVIVLLCVLAAVSDGVREPTCKYSSGACPLNYSPVCGSDGVTYSNECMLCVANKASKTKILIQKQGECEPPQPNCKYSSDVCPKIYSPVCGSDGKTYSNECELCAANKASKTKILIQKQGECDNHKQPNCKYSSDLCPKIYSPVCGSDGKTYSNECELCAANKVSKTKILIQKQGECDNRIQPNCKYSSDVCPLNYSPVCGSDGKTYSNECELCVANKASKTKILIQKQGKCDKPIQPDMCPMHYSPVCGSDGKTYSNECMLRLANKASKTKILIQKQGECEPVQPDICPMHFSPVCGSDGVTYDNECKLRVANKTSKTKIFVQKDGECEPVQPNCKYSSDVCPLNYSPVCGSDGKTYSNECELCAANKVSKTKILIQKQGECQPLQPNCKYPSDVCPMNYSPLCGSDGKTYGNECELCAAIKASKAKILIQNQGECDNRKQPNCKYSSDMCPMIYSPVCGSDGVTYSNECMLCGAIKASNKKVFIQKQGPC